MASQPHHGNTLAARNEALFFDYLNAGYSQKALAQKYELTPKGLESLLARHGIKLPREERSRRRVRRKLKPRGKPKDPRGRKAVWPDCPPALMPEYMRLRKKGIPAAEARALLDTRPREPTIDDVFLAALERERALSVDIARSMGALDSPSLRQPAIVNRAWEREIAAARKLHGEGAL